MAAEGVDAVDLQRVCVNINEAASSRTHLLVKGEATTLWPASLMNARMRVMETMRRNGERGYGDEGGI